VKHSDTSDLIIILYLPEGHLTGHKTMYYSLCNGIVL